METSHLWPVRLLETGRVQHEMEEMNFPPSLSLDLDIYATYERVITPQAIEGLTDVFEHIVYPMYVI